MNLLKNKKHTETRKETAPLKMKRGQKKLFALYAVMVLSICIGATCVYAAGDPLTVVNNLSTFNSPLPQCTCRTYYCSGRID
jgi:hypothetical protein